jgi:peptidoglycan/LPS O-acetylase OafA/YrhL
VTTTVRSAGSGPSTEHDLETVAAPSRPATRMAHLRSLDGLRGVAVLVVVLYHFSPGILPGGFLGVDMFFVLSGFLITSLLVNEWEGMRRISLPAFWARRARRLLPALFLVLAVVGFYAVFIAHAVEAQHVANDGLAALSYVANWRFIASGQAYIQQYTNQAASPLRHMWSLAIEEQFYLFWPLLVAGIGLVAARGSDRAGRRRRRLRRALFTVCVVLGAASLLRMVTLYHPGGDPNRVYYGTDTRAFVLLIGAALGALSAGAPVVASPRVRRVLVSLGCVSAIALIVVMATVTTNSPWLYEGGYGGLAVLIVVVLAAAAQTGGNLLARLLEWRPLVGLGLISYGVYLWHWPATVWLTTHSTGLSGPGLFTLRAATTLVASIASYVIVEQPIRRGHLPTLHAQTPGVVPMAVVTTVAVVLLIPALTLPSIQLAPAVPASKATALVTARYTTAPHCTDTSQHPAPLVKGRVLRVQLVGNSLAVEITSCLSRLLAARGATLTTVTHIGYPLCDQLDSLRQSLRDPATRPDISVLFTAASSDPNCGASGPWPVAVGDAINLWKHAGVHIYLALNVPAAGSKAKDISNMIDPGIARRDPSHVGVLDASAYLLDDHGIAQAQMPCLPKGEPGCANHLIAVRDPLDHVHFCSSRDWQGATECPASAQGGDRRVAAAIVASLASSLRDHPPKLRPVTR